jgi:hypothetical protein
VVQQKLNQASEQQQQLAEGEGGEMDADTARRIADLHKYSARAGPLLTEIPELIDRLEALSPLHVQVISARAVRGSCTQILMPAEVGFDGQLGRDRFINRRHSVSRGLFYVRVSVADPGSASGINFCRIRPILGEDFLTKSAKSLFFLFL